ncbi:hypothetical protein AMJ49_00570 [Parcubacteria bacterium DG_74_2]|nr:MAG: hypothetical protein AMJ49_00570 [Parcubacteria bacterium DG_74_2]
MRKQRTNWKYIFIVAILAFIVGGVSYWQCKFWPKEEVLVSEIEKPKKIEVTEELVNKIIDKIVPKNYDRETICSFIDDLDNDEFSEIILVFTPTPPTSEAYFTIVVPTNETGNYKKIADFTFGKEDITFFRSTPCVYDTKDLLDIDNDGKKEIILDLGTGGASNEAFGVFKINWNLNKIDWLKLKRKDQIVENTYFLRGGSIMHQEIFEVKDLNSDGVMEIIEKTGEYIGTFEDPEDWKKEESWKWQITVYKWNGSIFDYNEELSTSF